MTKMSSLPSGSFQSTRGVRKKCGKERGELGLAVSGISNLLDKPHKNFGIASLPLRITFIDSSHFHNCSQVPETWA